MDCYLPDYARLYDVFYGDKPYPAEARFVADCFERFAQGEVQRVLELACGTGAHAFELEKLGYEVLATDASEGMLEVARANAKARESNLEFQVGDMCDLDVPGPPFDAIVCLFDSIGYAQTNAGVMAALRGVREHLRPGGVFVFEFWHAAAMLRSFDPVRVRRWKTGDAEIVRISETSVSCADQISSVKYSVFELRADGTYAHFEETQRARFFLMREMDALVAAADMEAAAWFSGFRHDENIDEDTWHVVAVARRRPVA